MLPVHAFRVALGAVMSMAAFAASAQPHAHGHATLEVAVEPRSISIQFSTPLDNLVGFERAPRNDKERQLVDAALARLSEADVIFKIDPTAQCKLDKAEFESAALKLGKAAATGKQPGHADLDASYAFSCADASKARFIEVGLFEFKRLHEVDAQVAGPSGQLKRELKRSSKRLPLVN